MLEAKDIECVRGDRRLFRDLSLRLTAGELLHIHGHNGSGKSTLLRTLCGLFQPTRGEVSWNGAPINTLREEFGKEVLYIGHKPGIKDDLTALENLDIASKLDGESLSEEQAWQALDQMGLRGFEDLPSKHLSQGQKRRVALARLLVSKARLWVLDEPFSALDKSAVAALQAVISSHLRAGGMVVLTTHQEVALTQGEVKQLRLGTGDSGHV